MLFLYWSGRKVKNETKHKIEVPKQKLKTKKLKFTWIFYSCIVFKTSKKVKNGTKHKIEVPKKTKNQN